MYWIAAEKNGFQKIFNKRPSYNEVMRRWEGKVIGHLGFFGFHEIKFENSPIEVELKLKEEI